MFELHYEYLSDLIIEKIYSVSTIYTEKNKKAKRQNRPMWALVIKYEGETQYISNEKNIFRISIILRFYQKEVTMNGVAQKQDVFQS